MAYFTDGACSGNPGPGGYGVVLVDNNDTILWQHQEKKELTTNNEMELMAILKALQHIRDSDVEDFFKPIIYSDSAYCVNLINTWMYGWERAGWRRPKNQEVKNLEIIKQIYDLAHLAEVRKVSGHSGIKWNEYADGLATFRIKTEEGIEYNVFLGS